MVFRSAYDHPLPCKALNSTLGSKGVEAVFLAYKNCLTGTHTRINLIIQPSFYYEKNSNFSVSKFY